ncbi:MULTISPECIES: WXG100 family type VII secretion target [Mycobacterium]|uniref:WXG100 family type VII secretion target n=1 Tax=Mycobacterium TaxID=1763 RepID=UPI0007A01E03|nr:MULTISPECIES: WXG100 family type VII secretion target [Mycobacterium]MCV7100897.1 WXG100 family type VII secretion target [Mycobacterium palustre]MDV3219687.1 WXG100 family type VII secretion target [Mycobacterium avium]
MTGYTVDVDALDALQSQMQRYLTKCTESLERVESLIGVVSKSWDGTAAAAYQQRHRQWVDALGEMKESLDEFKAWSATAEDAYRTVMAMNLRMAGA